MRKGGGIKYCAEYPGTKQRAAKTRGGEQSGSSESIQKEEEGEEKHHCPFAVKGEIVHNREAQKQ